MQQKITPPRKLQGFMELDGMKQLKFEEMLSKIKQVFEGACFVPIDSPVLELSSVLLAKSGGDIDKEIYRFTKGSSDMCMRYDFTVPLARYVAMNQNSLSFPFKRFQIGKNYRGERPQKGRFREFYQCDADIIGSEDLPLFADAECVALYPKAFESLNLECVVEISNRKLLAGIFEENKISNTTQVLTILDKSSKIGKEETLRLLNELNLPSKTSELLFNFTSICGDFEKTFMLCKEFCNNETFKTGLNELKLINEYLILMGINKNSFVFNMGIIRGHDYYTGTVFETFLKDNKSLGAVGAGGRYDNLASCFTNQKMPGVGMSIGLTRLFDALDKNNMFENLKKSPVEVCVIPLGETLNTCIALNEFLRKNNIKSDISFEERNFKNKLKEANKKEIPFVVIVGEEEEKKQIFTIKNMQNSTQQKLSKEEIVKVVKN